MSVPLGALVRVVSANSSKVAAALNKVKDRSMVAIALGLVQLLLDHKANKASPKAKLRKLATQVLRMGTSTLIRGSNSNSNKGTGSKQL